ncbi:hypothetical protein ACFLUE_01875 [Chloroflexota bacterium]
MLRYRKNIAYPEFIVKKAKRDNTGVAVIGGTGCFGIDMITLKLSRWKAKAGAVLPVRQFQL